MKKIFITALVFLTILIPVDVSARVSETHSAWADESLAKADEAGILPDCFEEGDLTEYITRMDFAHSIFKMLSVKNITEGDNSKITFADTDDSEISVLAGMGIISGKSDTEFAPEDKLTREEAASILMRTARVMGVKDDIALFDTRFSDFDAVSDWAKSDVCKTDSLGIMRGTGENNFSPQMNYTKEQSAATLLRLYNLDISDYAEDVYETKAVGDISIFRRGESLWIKNAGTLLFHTKDREQDLRYGKFRIKFFQRRGEWYFYLPDLEKYADATAYDTVSGAEAFVIKEGALQYTERVRFADDYYEVYSKGRAGAEPVIYINTNKVYSYDGEELGYHRSSTLSGDSGDDLSGYICNNETREVEFNREVLAHSSCFIQGENLLDEYPYGAYDYKKDIWLPYTEANTFYGYFPAKLTGPDGEVKTYALCDGSGNCIRTSETRIFPVLEDGKPYYLIGDNDKFDMYDLLTNDYVRSFEWDAGAYVGAGEFVYKTYTSKGMESECYSPYGAYRVHGCNLLFSPPYTYCKRCDFINDSMFEGYTPVYINDKEYKGNRYQLYDPYGNKIYESETPIYLVKYNNKTCYAIERREENAWHTSIDIYDAADSAFEGTDTDDAYNMQFYIYEHYFKNLTDEE